MKLIVGEPQIYDPLGNMTGSDLPIAVLHHPFNWLTEFDCRKIEQRLGQECHFILCGHEHEPRVQQIGGTTGNYFTLPTGASYDRRDRANSYNFVHLDLERKEGFVYLRSWSDHRNKWIKDEDSWENGPFAFSLDSSSTPSQKKSENISLAVQQKDWERAIIFCTRQAKFLSLQGNLSGERKDSGAYP